VQSRTGKRLLLIGGAGYIGSALLPKLLARGFSVRLLDLLFFGTDPIANLLDHPGLELISGDFRDVATVAAAVKGMDTVVHLGGIVGDPACALDEKVTMEVNLLATETVAEAARRHGIRRLVFASSCSVYGANDEVLDESSALNPVSLYAESKIASEKVLRRLANDRFAPVILRFGTIYGFSGRARFDLVVNLLTAKAVRENQITVFGGDQWRPFVFVDDAAQAVLLAVEGRPHQVDNEVFNVGSNAQNYTIQQAADIVHQQNPSARMVIDGSGPDRRNYRVNFDKVERVLGFAPRFGVAQGVRQIMDAFVQGQIPDYRAAKYNNHKFMIEQGLARLTRAQHAMSAAPLNGASAALTPGRDQQPA
jgi:nucleoside-diphosphate-sugar epimerase